MTTCQRTNGFKSIDFIVPTALLTEASKALDNFPETEPCRHEDTCPWTPRNRKAPEPPCHVHLTDSSKTIALYPHAQVLWFLPDMGRSLTLEEQRLYLQPAFTVASTRSELPPRPLSAAPQPSNRYPVIIPKLNLFMDTYMRLYIRDQKNRDGSYARQVIKLLTSCIGSSSHPGSAGIRESVKKHYEALARGDNLSLGR